MSSRHEILWPMVGALVAASTIGAGAMLFGGRALVAHPDPPGPVLPRDSDAAPSMLRQLFDTPTTPTAAMPASHDANFLAHHGDAVMAGQDCASCHHESSCTACHAGQPTPIAVHPPGYLAFHGHDAARDTTACATCHVPARWCAACHVDARVWSEGAARPVPGFGIHPPGWLDPSAGYNHADEAQRDLMSCTSCHTGESCVACHQYVNPHGRGFADRCSSMLEAGAPTCAACHTPTSTLPLQQLSQHPGCQR